MEEYNKENQYNKESYSENVVSDTNSTHLDFLLLNNRSFRGFDQKRIVTLEELEKIVEVNTKIPSAKNQQVLRFKLITKSEDSSFILSHIKLGALLPQFHLPFEGCAPEAYIIICSTIQESKWVDIDLGIASQSMLLKAVEMGLGGICIGAFNKEAIMSYFDLGLEPLLILAIGKGAEKIQLLSICESENHNYFRKKDIHFVPKVQVDDLMIK